MIQLTRKQSEAFNLANSGTKDFILYGGAIGGGKSYWLFTQLIYFCSVYQNSRWLFVRQSLPTIQRNTIPTLNKLMDMGLSNHVKDFKKDTYSLTFKNGSEIMFMPESYDSDKELNRFRGLEINGAAVDELNEIQYDTFIKLFERSGRWDKSPENTPAIILSTCNPTQNWVKNKIYDKWCDNSLPDRWSYIPAKISDNPHLSDKYLQMLKNMPGIEYKRFVEGDWSIINVNNPFAVQYSIEKHESESAVYDYRKTIYASIDFNINPFCIIFGHIWRDEKGEHVHIFDEASIQNGSIPEMVDYINNKYKNKLDTLTITGDNMGSQRDISQRDKSSYYDQLVKGLKISRSQLRLKANPTHDNSRTDVNYFLKNFNDFKINPKTCPILCRDMKIVQCDAFGQIIKRNRKDISQQADMLDGLRYFINTFMSSWIKNNLRNAA